MIFMIFLGVFIDSKNKVCLKGWKLYVVDKEHQQMEKWCRSLTRNILELTRNIQQMEKCCILLTRNILALTRNINKWRKAVCRWQGTSYRWQGTSTNREKLFFVDKQHQHVLKSTWVRISTSPNTDAVFGKGTTTVFRQTFRRTAFWKTRVSRHHGDPIEDPPKPSNITTL